MIQIQNIVINQELEKQEIKVRGLLNIIGATKVGSNLMVTAIVNTSSELSRIATIYVIQTGKDAMSLLLNPKHIGSVGKYHIFLGSLLPKR